jgi:hypothetical protein
MASKFKIGVLVAMATAISGMLILTSSFGEVSAKVLKAEITHSESLAALDSRLREGATFDKSLIDVGSPEHLNFYQIPSWLAGQFSQGDITTTSYFNFAKNLQDDRITMAKTNSVVTWGHFRDSNNQIWIEDNTPFSSSSEVNDDMQYTITKELFPIQNSNQEVVFKAASTSVVVDKATNKIKHITQYEQFTSYKPLSDNSIRWDRSGKEFSSDGKPLGLRKDWAIITRTGPFTPAASHAQMEKDLAIFLKHAGN